MKTLRNFVYTYFSVSHLRSRASASILLTIWMIELSLGSYIAESLPLKLLDALLAIVFVLNTTMIIGVTIDYHCSRQETVLSSVWSVFMSAVVQSYRYAIFTPSLVISLYSFHSRYVRLTEILAGINCFTTLLIGKIRVFITAIHVLLTSSLPFF